MFTPILAAGTTNVFMRKGNQKLVLFIAVGFVLFALLGCTILIQVGKTLADVPGQGYLWAYLYLPAAILGGLVFMALAKGLTPPEGKPMVDRTLLLFLGILIFISSIFFTIRAISSIGDLTTGIGNNGTGMLRSITASLLSVLGFITGLASVLTSGKGGGTTKWMMLLITCFLLAFLIDQTAAILPMPDISVYGPLVISISLGVLFFLELAKCRAGNRKTFRNALVFGWLGGVCSLTGVLLWFIYPGLFLGKMEPAVLIILLSQGVFMLLTSMRMLIISQKTDHSF